MKNISKLRTLLLLLLCVGYAHAQDYTKVDNTVKTYPTTYNSIDRLASRISADFSRDDEKARALFTWIALNIRYDTSPGAMGRKPLKYSYSTEAERLAKIAAIESDLANTTLKSKKGVCHGYAMLYAITARKLDLETEVIHGNAKILPKDIGKLPTQSNHAWNAIKINGQWKLIDVTWGSGGITGNTNKFGFKFDDNYFFTSPDAFFLNHFPDDKKWLLTNKSDREFASLPLYYDLSYQLVSPAIGVIRPNGAGMLPFKIIGIKPTDEVAYQYTTGAYSSKVEPKITNGIGEFNVLVSKTGGTLTIFVNKQSIAAYSVER
ncbi:transglutaminase domain-containing protein [Flavobacterium sp. RHBU_24]|uniref:transglutaminase domain-containing protein n=1 Tax=Flavobacterium sp. RHBU_24 TaxID=3391185 RepID=UPI003984AE5B